MHHFYIPVMGTAFTIDTPLKVAPYGVNSVISLVDDVLIEQMREYYCRLYDLEYVEINEKDKDHRTKRITAYLNLLNMLVKDKMASNYSELEFYLSKYVELIPPGNNKTELEYILALNSSDEKKHKLISFFKNINIGTIDVNIMTKLNKENYYKGEKLPAEFNDAVAAFRGYAASDLESSLILSAGINPSLYSYINTYSDFMPNEMGQIKKKIIVKVSDFRSAQIQGRFLAKKGIWVSEFRVESGLNCGGHAFATQGYLMGPILQEFKDKKEELQKNLKSLCNKTLLTSGSTPLPDDLELKISAQGGVGTFEEAKFLKDYYNLSAIGWGTPFLLAPDVVRIDKENLNKLIESQQDDIQLSDASPLGVKFWNLMNSSSENLRRERIQSSKPGSPCSKGFIKFNTEFSKKPICTGSTAYIKLKLKEIEKSNFYSEKQKSKLKEKTLAKSCICHDLAGGATFDTGIDSEARAAICPGPNAVYFYNKTNFEEMVSHIYGRKSLPIRNGRPHMLIAELQIYIHYLQSELEVADLNIIDIDKSYYYEFADNLLSGIEYYYSIADKISESTETKSSFITHLTKLKNDILELQKNHHG